MLSDPIGMSQTKKLYLVPKQILKDTSLVLLSLFLLLGVLWEGIHLNAEELNIGSLAGPRWVKVNLPTLPALARHKAVIVETESDETLCAIGGDTKQVYCYPLGPTGVPDASGVPGYSLDESRRRHAAAAVGNRIYVLGGMVGDDLGSLLKSVHCAQRTNGSWHINSHGSMKKRTMQHAAVIVDNRIYVMGGFDGSYLADVWSADVGTGCVALSENDWRPEASLRTKDGNLHRVSGHAAVTAEINGKKYIYVIGGMPPGGSPTNVILRAEVGSNGFLSEWDDLGAVDGMPGMWLLTAAVSERYLYVLGGSPSSQATVSSDEVYRARIEDNGGLTWISPPENLPGDLPVPLHAHAAAVSGAGRLYVVGGISNGVYQNKVYFTPLLDFDKRVMSAGPIISGDEIIYALQLANLGIRDLEGLVITDTISSDASLTFPSLSPGCLPPLDGHTVITCSVPSLPLSQTVSLTYTVVVSSSASAVSESSQASLSRITVTDLSAKRHDASVASLEPGAGVDLSLEKSGTPTLVIAGETLTYILLVRNEGNAKAKGVVVTDDLPTGVTYQSATLPPDSTDPLRWSLGDLGGQASREIRVVVRVDPDISGTLINTASVSSDSNDNYPGNNQDEVCTVVFRRANLSIHKTDNPDPVLPGGTLTYTLVVANAGPSHARDVRVWDFLPSGLEVIATMPPATGGPNRLEWRFDLQAGQSRNIQIVTAVDPGSSGTISNTAEVFSNDDPLSPKTDQERTAISSRADLGIVKLDYPDPVNPGEVLTYTLLVTNAGPSRAVNVVVTDTLPAGVCSPGPPPNCVKGPLVYSLDDMSNKASRQIQIPVVVSPTITGTLSNQAEVSSDTPDSDCSDNTAWSVTAIMSGADLQLDIVHDPALVVAGSTTTYTLKVTNNGPSDALNVTIADAITPPVTVITATPPYIERAGTPTVITWYVYRLARGQSRELQLVVRVSPSSNGILTNATVVTSSTPDNRPDNNQDSDEAPIYQLAGLHIEKRGRSTRFTRGGTLVYTLQITNEGPSDAHNVVVSDTLPLGVSSSDPLIWHRNLLQADGVWTIEVAVVVDPATMGPLLNRACVGSDTPDCDPSDNCDNEQTFIVLVATNQAIVCEERLWCKESNRLVVVVNPWNIYLPVVVHN